MKKILLILALILLPTFVHADTLISNGLVGYWTFDGKDTPGRAIDRSGNNNTGYFSGIATSTFYTAGKIGQAVKLDGVNDYANVGDPANGSLDFGTGNFTYMTWIKGTDFSATVYAIGKGINGTGYSLEFVSDGSGGGIVRPTISDGTVTVNRQYGTLQPNTWYHVAVVADRSLSTGPTVYVNGVSSTCTANCAINFTTVASISNTNQLAIGQRGADNPGNYFPGFLDDVRIYNRALSQTEVTQLYNNSKVNFITPPLVSNGLVGYWTFDGKDMTGGRAFDRSGNGRTGYTQSIATSTFYTQGKIGQGLKFDGVDDYIVSTTNPFSAYPFTLNAWFKAPNTAGSFISYANTTSNVIYYALGVAGSAPNQLMQAQLRSSVADETSFIGTATLIPGKWYMATLIINSPTDQKIYLNGVLDASNSVSIPFVAGDNIAVGVANRSSQFGFWPGTLDEARFYNRALSTTELLQLYNNGKNVLLTPSYDTNGLIGWWTFDGKDMTNGVVADRSGQNIKGNVANIATSTFYTQGKIGQGLKFDGTDDTVSFGDVASFESLSAFSVGGWYKFSSNPTGVRTLVGKFNGNTVNGPFDLGYSTVSEAFFMTVCAPNNVTCANGLYSGLPPATVNDGKWHYLVGTYNGANVRVYLDGVVGGTSSALTGATVDSTVAFTLGSSAALNDFFNGYLDNFRFYNRALSATEVTQLYNSGINTINK